MATKVKPKPKTKPSRNGVHPPEVLTLAEAAAFLRTTETAVRTELESGRLGGRMLAGEWRVSKAAVLAWLAVPAPRPPASLPVFEETPEEQEAFLKRLRELRDEDDRATNFGKYAEDE